MRRPPNLWRHPKTGAWYLRLYNADGSDAGRRSLGTTDLRRATELAPGKRAEFERTQPRLPAGKRHWLELAAADVVERGSLGATQAHLEKLKNKWKVIVKNLPEDRGPDVFDYPDAIAYQGKRRAQTWQGEPIRGQTIYRETAAIWRALLIAKSRGLRSAMPDRWPKVKRNPKHQRKAGKHWEPELVREWLMMQHQDARDEAIVAAVTQLRSAEVRRLLSSTLRRAPRGSQTPWLAEIGESATKTREARIVGVPEIAYQIIRRRMAAQPGVDHVFAQADFKKHRARISRDLKFTCNLTLRDLRHTFASEALRLTGDATAVMRAQGHKDLRTTEKYQHSTVLRTTAVAAAAADVLYPDHTTRHTMAEATAPKTRKRRKMGEISEGKLERAKGLEPSTLSLGTRLPSRPANDSRHLGSAAVPQRPGLRGPVLAEPAHPPGTPARKRGGVA